MKGMAMKRCRLFSDEVPHKRRNLGETYDLVYNIVNVSGTEVPITRISHLHELCIAGDMMKCSLVGTHLRFTAPNADNMVEMSITQFEEFKKWMLEKAEEEMMAFDDIMIARYDNGDNGLLYAVDDCV